MRNSLTKLALASAALIGLSTSAHAFVIISLQDLNTGIASTYNSQTNVSTGAGSFIEVDDDNVLFNGTVGDFTVTNATGFNNHPGTPAEAFVSAATTNVQNNNGVGTGIDVFYVNVISFGFTMPAGEEKTLFGAASNSTSSGVTGGTVRSRFSADPNNAGALVNAIECTMAIFPGTGCNTGTPIVWQDPAISNAGFSIRTEQYFNVNGGGRAGTTSTATVGTVPEPMTTSLVGGALLALALSSRRRSRKA